jgi:predicted O-methyltransferase YrrM
MENLHKLIKKDTLDAGGRCNHLKGNIIKKYVKQLKAKLCAEIGVFKGSSLMYFIESLAETGGKVIGIDPYLLDSFKNDIPNIESKELIYEVLFTEQKVLDEIYEELCDIIQNNNLTVYVDLIRDKSENISQQLKKESIDILHIDGNHDESNVSNDIKLYLPLVKVGGVIIMDDVNWIGVKNSIDKYLKNHCILLESYQTFAVYKKINNSSKIEQVCLPQEINFFKENLIKRYNLLEYNDIEKPTLFFGLRNQGSLIDNHKGLKLLLPSSPIDIPKIKNYENVIFICSDKYELPPNIKRKSLTPEIKDYNIFTPTPLGDKIYLYSGFQNGWNLKNNNLINEIQKRINYEIITTSHSDLTNYYDINYLKTNYYDKSFINLNLTNFHGLATTIELGLMGRKTIIKNININSIQRIDFPNFIYYETIDDIVEIINEESKKIGTIQPSINAHNVGDEWLDLSFWV